MSSLMTLVVLLLEAPHVMRHDQIDPMMQTTDQMALDLMSGCLFLPKMKTLSQNADYAVAPSLFLLFN
jgi:hypothetical protein